MEVSTQYRLLTTYGYDPTKTLTLRNAWTRDFNKRFKELIRVIREAVVTNDVFGIGVQTNQLTPPLPGQFNFPTTSEKVEAFMEWLRTQVDRGLLETHQFTRVGSSIDAAWTNTYIGESYKRGILRAQQELRKAGYDVPPTTGLNTLQGVISSPFTSPFHADVVGVLYTRVFSELRNITNVMDNIMSQVLSQGLIDGDHPDLLARKLVSVIDGSGRGTLDLPIEYTRPDGRVVRYTMPAKQRAATLARTETIRAHHRANIQEYRNWGVDSIEVIAEFVTAGDDRVCTECAGYHGNRYTLKEAEFLIPVHPNCRCIVIPVAKQDVKGKIIGL